MLVCNYEHPENVQFYPLSHGSWDLWTFKLKSVLLLICFTENEEEYHDWMFIKRSRDQYAAAHLKNVQFIGGDGWWWEVSGLTWWTSAGRPWVGGCQAPAASYTCCGSLTGDVYGTSSSSTYHQYLYEQSTSLLKYQKAV